MDLDGSNSNAALANLLKAPVILVIDARGMTRGIAPLILGYQAFDKDINISGVVLNQLGGSHVGTWSACFTCIGNCFSADRSGTSHVGTSERRTSLGRQQTALVLAAAET